MMCFIELVKRVGHNYNSPIDPTAHFAARLARMSRGRKLPRRSGDVGNGPDTATDDGSEE